MFTTTSTSFDTAGSDFRKGHQQLLGHATIVVTMRYAHLSPDVKRAAVEALDSPPAKDGQWMGNEQGRD